MRSVFWNGFGNRPSDYCRNRHHSVKQLTRSKRTTAVEWTRLLNLEVKLWDQATYQAVPVRLEWHNNVGNQSLIQIPVGFNRRPGPYRSRRYFPWRQ